MHVQDPVARSVSAWRMVQRTVCPPSRPDLVANCSLPAFHEVVAKETTSAGSGLPPQCLFNTLVCNHSVLSNGASIFSI